METTTEQKTPLQAFLEDTLQLGAAVQHPNIAALLDGQKSKYYSGQGGYLTASLDAVSLTQWHHLHIQEEGHTMQDVCFGAEGRIEDFCRRELAKAGLALSSNGVEPKMARRLATFVSEISKLHRSRTQEFAAQHEMHTSFTLRSVPDDLKNWDVVLRVLVIEPSESLYIQYVLPRVIQAHERLIDEEQFHRAANAALGYLEAFAPESAPLMPFTNIDPTVLIAHHLAHHPGVGAENLYGGYHDTVHVNKDLFTTPVLQRAAAKVVPWEELTELQRKLWSGAVEVARIYLQGALQYNRYRALQ